MISPQQGSLPPDRPPLAVGRVEPWRQVPLINLLQSAGGRRRTLRKVLQGGLVAVLLLEVLLASAAYRNLSALRGDVRAAQEELNAVGN